MTAVDRIAEIQARADAATKGPWPIIEDSADGLDEAWCRWHKVGPIELCGEKSNDDDIFIAAARADVPALCAALTVACEALRQCDEDLALASVERIIGGGK
jgi:hypothetical protein